MPDFNLNAKQTLEFVTKQVSTANYRARNIGLADTLTVEQWLTVLNYWNWRCAICDLATQDLSPDHWIPLSNDACPGSTYDNMVALCEGCNSNKHRTEPVQWLTNRLGSEMATEKLDKVRKSFQELTTPNHPYNTTIPERVWLKPSNQAALTHGKVIVTFDLSIPAELQMWNYYTISLNMDSSQLRNYVKNFLWLASTTTGDVMYTDWTP